MTRAAGRGFPVGTVVGVAWVAAALPATAHQVGLSRGQYAISGRTVSVELVAARLELLDSYPELRSLPSFPADGPPPAALLDVAASVGLASDAGPCDASLLGVSVVEGDGILLRIEARCPGSPARITITSRLHESLGAYHRHVAHAVAGPRTADAVLSRQQPSFSIDVPRLPARGGALAAALASLWREPVVLLLAAAVGLQGGARREAIGACLAMVAGLVAALGAFAVAAPPPARVMPALLAVAALALTLDVLRRDTAAPDPLQPLLAAWSGLLLGGWAAARGGDAVQGLPEGTLGRAAAACLALLAAAGMARALGSRPALAGRRAAAALAAAWLLVKTPALVGF